MFNRAVNALFIIATVFLVAAPETVYSQRDRPDSVGSRSIGGKDAAQRQRDRRLAEDPEAKVDEQLRSTPRTANVNAMRRKTVTAAGVTAEDYADAIELSRLEYETKFKLDLKDETFANTHAAIRLEDFARAYIIALDPIVQRKLGGYQLAVLRSKTTTYGNYDEILQQEVPELSKEAVKTLVDNAKKVVKAALSKE
jgi:hypothetical protein